ncbi:Aste57867_21153 [Aphanomyces stellatus]|uniref:Aste57867_21153 protein n=1 Tax=Aphanomyces stellatus TaxID=120398 RepID=A0A485LHH3_9STRA|nr:hypothetical protein As57867_021085 [Aphanomyces stellatus]VFT97827.1 Aste57867_21153 [Aphanomyces stellatus]
MLALLCVLVAAATLNIVHGCSEFLLNTTSDQVVSARTMDFNVDLHTLVEIIPRNTLVQEPPVRGCPDCLDYAWRTKLGFVAFNSYGYNSASDGLNEKGLSAACLYLVGTVYPTLNVTDISHRPIVSSMITYILGNFETVDDVKRGLNSVQLTADIQDDSSDADNNDASNTDPLHVSVHDAAGQSIVIEFLNGTVHIYDNPNGVLTNQPPLHDQLALLAAHDKKQGTTDVAFPGGYDAVQRFQRLSLLNRHANAHFLRNTSYSVATPDQAAVAAALHILDTVIIPTAHVPIFNIGGMPSAYEASPFATQYTVVRDHKNLRVFFRSTENQVLKSIDLTKIDFGNPANRKALPVEAGEWHVDVTAAVLDSTLHSADMPPRSVVEGLLQGKIVTQANAVMPESGKVDSFWTGVAVGATGAAIAFFVLSARKRQPEYTPLV